MAARYWRITGIAPYAGGALSLSEIALYAGASRADTPGSLTGTAPDSGALSALQDSSAAANVTWSATKVKRGLSFVIDLGSAVEVTSVRFGAAGTQNEFVRRFFLQSSADGVTWSDARNHGDVTFPGANTMTGDVWDRIYPASLNLLDAGSSLNWLITNGATLVNTGAVGSPAAQGIRGFLSGQASGAVRQFEAKILAAVSYNFTIGVALAAANLNSTPGQDANAWVFDNNGATVGAVARKRTNGVQTNYGINLQINDVLGVVVNGDDLIFYINGVSQGVAFTGMAARTLYPVLGWRFNTQNERVQMNFGGTAFAYPVAGAVPWAEAAPGVSDKAPSVNELSMPFSVAGEALQPFGTRAPAWVAQLKDMEVGGFGIISGTVKEDASPDVPVHRRVRLFRQRDGIIVSEVWSDPVTGAYSFPYLSLTQKFFVAAFDHTGGFTGVIADNLSPTPMV